MVVGNDVGSVVSPKANLAIAPAWTPVFVAGTPRYTNGELLLTLAGAPGSNYEVLVSTDLATWKTSRVLALTNRTASFTEPATNVPLRYYRARLAP